MPERALTVTAQFDGMSMDGTAASFSEELGLLSKACGLILVGSRIWRNLRPQSGTLIGKGKLEEIRTEVVRASVDVVVFGCSLTGTQQRNIEEALGVKTIDRTQLILDIFARRARSLESQLQVELAQLKYLLPRLTGKGVALSRLGGGVGTRGPGEQKLEVDRRRVREKITRLSRELRQLARRRADAIDKKKKGDRPLVALAGYTNAGKSTLFNALTLASTLTRDQLFSTLDTTTRLAQLPDRTEILLSDTVGFIADLPHDLIEAFKSTLEEVVQADLLLHVIDASAADLEVRTQAVMKVLGELGADPARIWHVYNKSDRLSVAPSEPERCGRAFCVSALTGLGLDALKQAISDHFASHRRRCVVYASSALAGEVGHFLYRTAHVIGRVDRESGTEWQVRIDEKDLRKLTRSYGPGVTIRE